MKAAAPVLPKVSSDTVSNTIFQIRNDHFKLLGVFTFSKMMLYAFLAEEQGRRLSALSVPHSAGAVELGRMAFQEGLGMHWQSQMDSSEFC